VVELLAAVWEKLPHSPKRLIWLTDRDYKFLLSRFREQPDIIVLEEDWCIDRLIVASDLVITKANRLTVYEAASLGAPSVSISNGVNWPDEVAVARVASNTALDLYGLTVDELLRIVMERIENGWVSQDRIPCWDGVAGAALRIEHHVQQIRVADAKGQILA
jgi:hypothetical protein